ncbi:MAG: AAA family ATPase [Treponema sp.]|nr:AAA family ATPase [Treponema sp.]
MKDVREAERCFLSSLLRAIEQGKAETKLKADDFDSPVHKQVFITIMAEIKAGFTPTFKSLVDGTSGMDVRPSEIAEITDAVPIADKLKFYEDQVEEASTYRQFIQAMNNTKAAIDSGKTDIKTAINNFIPALAAVTNVRNEARIATASELLDRNFPPIRWIVPGLIGEGTTLLGGAPKIGKSWFVLNLAIAAAAGGGFLGSLRAEKTKTLYLALEDTGRRIQSRLKKLGAPRTDDLHVATQWKDGYIGLENYLKVNDGIKLVVIDTLARFSGIKDMNDYSETDTAMARLKRIADDLGVAIVVIHHAKKAGKRNEGVDWMESILGSTGLTGASDTMIVITRTRDADGAKNTATLHATGRDTADIKHHLKLDLDCGGWAITSKTELSSPDKKTSGKDDARDGWT